MAIRATILMVNDDKTITGLYLHNCGSYSIAGETLQEYYSTKDRVESLIALGDLSKLGSKLEPEVKNHSFSNPETDVCVAYARDRGEDLQNYKFEDIESALAHTLHSYIYVYDDNVWYVVDSPYKDYENSKIGLDVKLESLED